MTSISLKTINFSGSNLDQDELKQFEISSNLTSESPKSVAYVIRWQLARRRSGSAKVKSMSEISGTTAKPHKQKGTGRARQGSKRSVQFVGGRTCHGPSPRSFDFSMPKKIVKIALSDALKEKIKDDKIALFSNVGLEKINTSKANSILKSNNITNAVILLDKLSKDNHNLIMALRNLKHIKVLDVKALNVYDLLKFDKILINSQTFENNILGALK